MSSLLLLPKNDSNYDYYGYININNQLYDIQILNFNKQDNNTTANNDIKIIFSNDILKSISLPTYIKSSSLEEYVSEIISYYSKYIKVKSSVDIEYYDLIYNELNKIGWYNIKINDLNNIELINIDKSNRTHVLILKLYNYPSNSPSCNFDLPIENISLPILANEWDIECTDLLAIYSKFIKLIEKYQLFFNIMDDFNKYCHILGKSSKYSNTEIRIKVGKHVCMIIDINPNDPYNIPKIRFTGSDISNWKETEGFKWNNSIVPRLNLEKLFNFKFQLESESAENVDDNCPVCYSFMDEKEQMPQIKCSNIKCNKQFHQECLSNWLQALPTSKRSYLIIFGACPNCSEIIKCPTSN